MSEEMKTKGSSRVVLSRAADLSLQAWLWSESASRLVSSASAPRFRELKATYKALAVQINPLLFMGLFPSDRPQGPITISHIKGALDRSNTGLSPGEKLHPWKEHARMVVAKRRATVAKASTKTASRIAQLESYVAALLVSTGIDASRISK